MTAKSLFTVILKVLGIYFVKDIVLSLPTLLSVFYSFGDRDVSGAISTFLISFLTLLVYFVVAYGFIFKTEWVMERLRILDNLPQDPIPFNIHRSTVISISILVVALLIITEAVPLVIRGLTKWFQYKQMTRGLYSGFEAFDYSMILVHAGEIIIGLLMIGYQRQLVNYIEIKTRRQQY